MSRALICLVAVCPWRGRVDVRASPRRSPASAVSTGARHATGRRPPARPSFAAASSTRPPDADCRACRSAPTRRTRTRTRRRCRRIRGSRSPTATAATRSRASPPAPTRSPRPSRTTCAPLTAPSASKVPASGMPIADGQVLDKIDIRLTRAGVITGKHRRRVRRSGHRRDGGADALSVRPGRRGG